MDRRKTQAQPSDECDPEELCCHRLEVPNYFWDWLLFPVAIDDTIQKLQDLAERLAGNNANTPDFEQVNPAGPLPALFGEQLSHNYDFLAATGPEEGCLAPLNAAIDSWIARLQEVVA
ncbi:hypothetical protein QOT17_004575 [Balamuthia mandrillaris]